METILKDSIENYQCPGCVVGGDISCYKKNDDGGIGCGAHVAGTMAIGVGSFFLGLPKGFNRLGKDDSLKPIIFKSFSDLDWDYETFNVPVWKHLNEQGHTLVRGFMPRRNEGFLHVFLEDCMESINCMEISSELITKMD